MKRYSHKNNMYWPAGRRTALQNGWALDKKMKIIIGLGCWSVCWLRRNETNERRMRYKRNLDRGK